MKGGIKNLNTIENGELNRINWFNSTINIDSQNSSPRSTLENSYGTFNRRESDLDQLGNRKILITKTKLIASIKKKFSSELITNFLKEGIRIFRINGELFNHKDYSKIIKEINLAFEKENLDERPTIIFDLKGPMPMITKLNIKNDDDRGVLHVRKGQVIKLTYDTGNDQKEEDNVICLDKKIAYALKQGDEILINNTKVVLQVIGFDRYKRNLSSRRNSATDRERKNFEKYRDEIFKNILRREGEDKKFEDESSKDLKNISFIEDSNLKKFEDESSKDLKNISFIEDSNLKKFSHAKSHSNLRANLIKKKEIDDLLDKKLKLNKKLESHEHMNENMECDEEKYPSYDPNCECDYDWKGMEAPCGNKKKILHEVELDPYETFPNTPKTEADFKKLEKAFQSIIQKQRIDSRNEKIVSPQAEKDNTSKRKERISNKNDMKLEEMIELENLKNSPSDNYSYPYQFLFNNDLNVNSHNSKVSPNDLNSRSRIFIPDKQKFNENEFLSRQINLFNQKNVNRKLIGAENSNCNSIFSKRQRIKSMNSNLHKLENECCVKKNNIIICEVKSEGTITEYKKLSVIERDLISMMGTPVIGAKDIIDISKSAELGVNFISCLVNNASNINDIKDLLSEESKNTIRILARIETSEAVHNFNEILEKVDGVIIFHGVFSNRIPVSDLIFLESYMIEKCKMHNKLILFQTENIFDNSKKFISELNTIDSMIKEGFDGIILKEEINLDFSKHINTIGSIKEILWQCEYEMGIKLSSPQDHFLRHSHGFMNHNYLSRIPKSNDKSNDILGLDSIFKSVVQASYSIDADVIIFYSDDPSLVKILSKLHPKCLILYPTSEYNVSAYVSMVRGVVPYMLDEKFKMENDKDQDYVTQTILENTKGKINVSSNAEKKVIVVTAFLDSVKKKRNSMFFFVRYV